MNDESVHIRMGVGGWRLLCVCCVSLAGLLTGCASTSPHDAADEPHAAMFTEQGGSASHQLLQGGERGLEVRQWLIADELDVIADAMGQYASADLLHEADQQRLRHNGLRLVRVPLDELDALERELGGASIHNTGWHGQIFDWQEVMARPLSHERAIAVDGRVRMFGVGTMRLMGRAWLVRMEDGTRLSAQIIPQHYRPGPMSYYRLLGRDVGEATSIAQMRIDLLMEEGYAYILTCESPAVDWPGLDEVDDDGEPRRAAQAGPDVTPPTTLGQFMLKSDHTTLRTGARGVLVFIPRIHSKPETDLGSISRRSAG